MKGLKRRKPVVYISMGLYILLSLFIIIEACIPSGNSTVQSDFFSTISAWIINTIKGPQVAKVIKPNELGSITDSSVLGQDEEGVSKIAIGTTTLLSIEVKYPAKKKGDAYDREYAIDYLTGNKDDYNIVYSTSAKDTSFFVYLRIVANNLSNDLYSFNVKFSDTSLNYEYKFHIVDLEEPKEYESRINKLNLKINETSIIETKLTGNDRGDYYLKRYYDVSKINRSSSNNEVATIDKYGVIHALKAGESTITFGKYTYNIHVDDEIIDIPAGNSLDVLVSEDANDNPCLLDYDYVFTGEDDPNDYSVLLYPNFSIDTLIDQSVSWEIDDDMKAKLSPYRYDEDGYPIYHDEDNKPCIRVSGYRKKGDIHIKAISNMDNTLTKDVSLNVIEALPSEMKVNVNGDIELIINQQKIISATFSPKNTANTAISITSSDESVISISNNNTTSVRLDSLKVGNAHIKVTSLANESLTYEFNITVKSKEVINDDNYNDFASFMRKFYGHFLLFGVTAVFGTIFFYTFFEEDKKLWLASLASLTGGFITAGVSEFIQKLQPSRTGAWMDVGIDMIGYLIGTILTISVILIIILIKYIKKKRSMKNES